MKQEFQGKEFFDALSLLEKENRISSAALVDKIQQGISKAIRRQYPDVENIRVEIDPITKTFDMALLKEVVDDEPLDDNEINIDEAKTINPSAMVGDTVAVKVSTAIFGRVAAQSAKQSIRHDIKEFERDKLLKQYKEKEHMAVSGTVVRIEGGSGNAIVSIDGSEVCLFKNEQIPGEIFREGHMTLVYVVGVVNPDRKPSIKISRTHKELVRKLFEREVPEISEGIVEVKSISREAGSRTKIAVFSADENVDAVGSCIGPKRSRITKIVEELRGEKIDIIPYSEKEETFVANALAPAEVVSVEISDPENRCCTVLVPANQLSLAIGNKGQNAKLAARLTGYKIDIRAAETALAGEPTPPSEEDPSPADTDSPEDLPTGEDNLTNGDEPTA